MKPTPFICEKKAAVAIWIGATVFTIGAMTLVINMRGRRSSSGFQ